MWTFTLEDDGRIRVLSTKGISFRNRDYVGAWMTGQAGERVRVRFMPHHDHRIEVFDPSTGRYLGPAEVTGQANSEQISAVRAARAARGRRLRKDLAATQQERYGSQTRPGRPERLKALTAQEAGQELAEEKTADLSRLALPDLIPPAAPPAGWRTPASLAALTASGQSVPLPSGSDEETVPDCRDGRAVRPTTDEDGGV